MTNIYQARSMTTSNKSNDQGGGGGGKTSMERDEKTTSRLIYEEDANSVQDFMLSSSSSSLAAMGGGQQENDDMIELKDDFINLKAIKHIKKSLIDTNNKKGNGVGGGGLGNFYKSDRLIKSATTSTSLASSSLSSSSSSSSSFVFRVSVFNQDQNLSSQEAILNVQCKKMNSQNTQANGE